MALDSVAGRPPKHAPCPFHERGLIEGSAALRDWIRQELPDAEALSERVAAEGRCPHVLTRALLLDAELVVAPYGYLFQPALRSAFLRWMGASLADLIVVVDEAHNLPSHARDLATSRLTRVTLERALAETRSFGDPVVLGAHPLSRLLRALDAVFGELAEGYLPEGAEDALLPPDEFDVLLLSSLQVPTPALDRALTVMEEYAAAVRDARRREGKIPRSHVGAVAAFLRAFRGLDAQTHAPIVERDGASVALVAFALDASLATEPLADASATLHLSGTLRPLEEYASSIGLDASRTSAKTFASPFLASNRLVLVDETVTTRHEDVVQDPDIWNDIGRQLQRIRDATARNMAVFLPSYDVLHRVAPFLRGRAAFVETRAESQGVTMARLAAFKATRGATLLSVMGGRLSEGIDFPDEELEVVVIVGLPYARPSAKGEALVRFYDRRFGKGWEWAVKVPMTRKVLQAAGRLIRTPTDRGVIVLLDRRAAMLRADIPQLVTTQDPVIWIRKFFE